MALADRLINTANKLLTKFQATDRPVYKRTVTKTGGDPLLGRGATVTTTDTILNPQPAVQVITAANLALGLSQGVLAEIGDYLMTVSSTMMSRADLENPAIVLVFKWGSSVEELNIVSFTPAACNGVDVIFEIVARSKKR